MKSSLTHFTAVPMGKLMITVMLAFAEYERDIIVERTQTGKAVARANGKRVDGRPKKFKPEQIAHALEMLEDGRSYTEVEKLNGISKSTLIRAVRKKKMERAIKAPAPFTFSPKPPVFVSISLQYAGIRPAFFDYGVKCSIS